MRRDRRAYNAAWRAANPEKDKARRAAYCAANREKINERKRARRAADPEREKPAAAAWKAANIEKSKARVRLTKYGVSPEAFQLMLLVQKSACGICKEPFLEKSPHVDHCHKTGKVRGLLCRQCNKGLGFFRDSPDFLKGALEYLEA